MERIIGRGGLRAAGAALLAFAVILIAGSAPSAAASYTLNFTGTVTGTPGTPSNLFTVLGVVAGDAVSGSVTIDPFNATVYSAGGVNTGFSQTGVSQTFHVVHPGSVDMTISDSAAGDIVTAGSPASVSGMQFQLQGAKSYLEMTFQTNVTGGPLTSLSGLPSTATGLVALFGGTSPIARGMYILKGFGTVTFDIAFSATAVTPIPAALPLFASALGGLGFVSRRRRTDRRAA